MIRPLSRLLLSCALLSVALPACKGETVPEGPPGTVGGSIDFDGPDLVFNRVFVDSPIARAGIRPYDRILKINDVPTDSMSIDQAKAAFRGPVGSSLTLSVATGKEPARTVTVTRTASTAKVPMPVPGEPAKKAPGAPPAAAPGAPPAAPGAPPAAAPGAPPAAAPGAAVPAAPAAPPAKP